MGFPIGVWRNIFFFLCQNSQNLSPFDVKTLAMQAVSFENLIQRYIIHQSKCDYNERPKPEQWDGILLYSPGAMPCTIVSSDTDGVSLPSTVSTERRYTLAAKPSAQGRGGLQEK